MDTGWSQLVTCGKQSGHAHVDPSEITTERKGSGNCGWSEWTEIADTCCLGRGTPTIGFELVCASVCVRHACASEECPEDHQHEHALIQEDKVECKSLGGRPTPWRDTTRTSALETSQQLDASRAQLPNLDRDFRSSCRQVATGPTAALPALVLQLNSTAWTWMTSFVARRRESQRCRSMPRVSPSQRKTQHVVSAQPVQRRHTTRANVASMSRTPAGSPQARCQYAAMCAQIARIWLHGRHGHAHIPIDVDKSRMTCATVMNKIAQSSDTALAPKQMEILVSGGGVGWTGGTRLVAAHPNLVTTITTLQTPKTSKSGPWQYMERRTPAGDRALGCALTVGSRNTPMRQRRKNTAVRPPAVRKFQSKKKQEPRNLSSETNSCPLRPTPGFWEPLQSDESKNKCTVCLGRSCRRVLLQRILP